MDRIIEQESQESSIQENLLNQPGSPMPRSMSQDSQQYSTRGWERSLSATGRDIKLRKQSSNDHDTSLDRRQRRRSSVASRGYNRERAGTITSRVSNGQYERKLSVLDDAASDSNGTTKGPARAHNDLKDKIE